MSGGPAAAATQRLGSAEEPTRVLPQIPANSALPPPVLAPPNPSTRTGAYHWAQWSHGLTALVAWCALALQLWLAVTDVPESKDVLTSVIEYFSFFTVLSNIVVAFVATSLAINPVRNSSGFPTFRLDSLLMITLTGLVYVVVLRPLYQPQGVQAVAEYLLHYAVALLVLASYVAFGPRPRLEYRDIGTALLIPLVWVTYTLGHGALSAWYPYPFVDVSTYGYGQVLANLAILLIIGAALAAVFVLVDKKLPWAPRR
jgi:hypothetical protein